MYEFFWDCQQLFFVENLKSQLKVPLTVLYLKLILLYIINFLHLEIFYKYCRTDGADSGDVVPEVVALKLTVINNCSSGFVLSCSPSIISEQMNEM